MVKLGPPDNVYDGLDLSKSEDRVTAIERLMGAVAIGESRMLASAEMAKSEVPPSAEQLHALWMGVACTSAAVRSLAKMMIAMEKSWQAKR